ncbi:MAG: hypothetical protein LWX54_10210 [Deltaproteobacteria bacterium]|nr:hypothetical protein [Deltaproteobacteria bacterium]
MKFDIVIRSIRKADDRVLQQRMYLPKPIRCWNIGDVVDYVEQLNCGCKQNGANYSGEQRGNKST